MNRIYRFFSLFINLRVVEEVQSEIKEDLSEVGAINLDLKKSEKQFDYAKYVKRLKYKSKNFKLNRSSKLVIVIIALIAFIYISIAFILSNKNVKEIENNSETIVEFTPDVGYINPEGEVELLDVDRKKAKVITNTEGNVTNFSISPDKSKVAVLIGSKVLESKIKGIDPYRAGAYFSRVATEVREYDLKTLEYKTIYNFPEITAEDKFFYEQKLNPVPISYAASYPSYPAVIPDDVFQVGDKYYKEFTMQDYQLRFYLWNRVGALYGYGNEGELLLNDDGLIKVNLNDLSIKRVYSYTFDKYSSPFCFASKVKETGMIVIVYYGCYEGMQSEVYYSKGDRIGQRIFGDKRLFNFIGGETAVPISEEIFGIEENAPNPTGLQKSILRLYRIDNLELINTIDITSQLNVDGYISTDYYPSIYFSTFEEARRLFKLDLTNLTFTEDQSLTQFIQGDLDNRENILLSSLVSKRNIGFYYNNTQNESMKFYLVKFYDLSDLSKVLLEKQTKTLIQQF